MNNKIPLYRATARMCSNSSRTRHVVDSWTQSDPPRLHSTCCMPTTSSMNIKNTLRTQCTRHLPVPSPSLVILSSRGRRQRGQIRRGQARTAVTSRESEQRLISNYLFELSCDALLSQYIVTILIESSMPAIIQIQQLACYSMCVRRQYFFIIEFVYNIYIVCNYIGIPTNIVFPCS